MKTSRSDGEREAQTRCRRAVAGMVLLMTFSLLIVACTGATPSAGEADGLPSSIPEGAERYVDPPTKVNSDGPVTVAVTWQGAAPDPVFTVDMDTHSVNLDGFDLRELAVLRVEGGAAVREVLPSNWEAPKGGHHRAGSLRFPATTADGGPLISPTTEAIELIIRDVAGVAERSFRWTL